MRKTVALIATIAAAYIVQGQALDPSIVSLGAKLAARTYIVPFANDAELKAGSSSFTLNITDWKQVATVDGDIYTATFKRPVDWNSRGVIVRIAGATSSYALDVNGIRVGYSQWGAGCAEFDITKFTKEFYNTLAITVFRDAVAEHMEVMRGHNVVGVGTVELVSQPTVRIEDIIVEAQADGARGIFSLRLAMQSTLLNNRNLTLQYELIARSGKTAMKEEKQLSLAPMKADTVIFRVVNFDKIETWTSESPKLYTLIVRCVYESRPIEIITRQVGFTSFSFSREGAFMVAGKPVQLIATQMKWQGSRQATEVQMRLMKANKANAVWVAGAPQPDEFYELADQIGLYVIDHADIATGAIYPNPSNDPAFLGAFNDRIIGAYKASRIHPSVIAYFSAQESVSGYCLSESYLNYKRIEKRRPLIRIGANGDWASDAVIISLIKEK